MRKHQCRPSDVGLYSESCCGAREHSCAPGLRDDRWATPVLPSRSDYLCDKSSEYIVGPHSREAEFSLQVTHIGVRGLHTLEFDLRAVVLGCSTEPPGCFVLNSLHLYSCAWCDLIPMSLCRTCFCFGGVGGASWITMLPLVSSVMSVCWPNLGFLLRRVRPPPMDCEC